MLKTHQWGRPTARAFGLLVGLLTLVAGCASSASTATPAPTATSGSSSPGLGTGSPASTPTTVPDSTVKTGWQVGQVAPDFTVTTLNGTPTSQAEIAAQGKPYILYFFATW